MRIMTAKIRSIPLLIDLNFDWLLHAAAILIALSCAGALSLLLPV